jgi:hypothetical protein
VAPEELADPGNPASCGVQEDEEEEEGRGQRVRLLRAGRTAGAALADSDDPLRRVKDALAFAPWAPRGP